RSRSGNTRRARKISGQGGQSAAVLAVRRCRCAGRVCGAPGEWGGQRSQGQGPQRSVVPCPDGDRTSAGQLATWILSSTAWILARVASESGAEPASLAAACWPSALIT